MLESNFKFNIINFFHFYNFCLFSTTLIHSILFLLVQEYSKKQTDYHKSSLETADKFQVACKSLGIQVDMMVE